MIDKDRRIQALKALNSARALREAYEGKELPADIKAQIDQYAADVEKFLEESKMNERLDNLENQITLPAGAQPKVGAPLPAASAEDPDGTKGMNDIERKAFRKALVSGMNSLTIEEHKVLSAHINPDGGYLIAPQDFISTLIKGVDNRVFMLARGTVYNLTTAQSLGVPTLDTDASDADWTGELTTVNEDTAIQFGKRELYPHPVSKMTKISKKLLRISALNPEEIVRQRMEYKFGVTFEKAFMTGSGVNQPLGIFTASADGISTGQDLTMANATSVDALDYVKTKMKLRQAYWPRAEWVLHRDHLSLIMQLKDTTGRFLFQVNLAGGTPATILDLPYNLSEYAPNTFTTGKYVGILGDLSNYWIARAQNFEIQTLVEKYAENNQNAYIGRAEIDGMPVLEEAFVRMKLA